MIRSSWDDELSDRNGLRRRLICGDLRVCMCVGENLKQTDQHRGPEGRSGGENNLKLTTNPDNVRETREGEVMDIQFSRQEEDQISSISK
jgi:hypothetical protein